MRETDQQTRQRDGDEREKAKKLQKKQLKYIYFFKMG